MALVRLLLAQVDVHHRGAGLERGLRLARHLLRGHRNMVLPRVGQDAVQRAGDDGFVGHGVLVPVRNRPKRYGRGRTPSCGN